MANNHGSPTRRTVVRTGCAIGGIGLSSLAGCVDDATGGNGGGDLIGGGPDPRVTDVEADQDALGALSGTVDIYVLVQNTGDDGDVEVTVSIYDENGNVIERVTQTTNIRPDESRRVDFEIDSPDGADRFNAEASPA